MKPYYEEPNAVLYQGHALSILKGLPSESVDCAITSPPYWGLRTYKTEPQIWGGWTGELGLEPTTELYIQHLIEIFNEVKRVLKKTGTCWVNIDDSYAGSGKGIGSDHGKAVFSDDDIVRLPDAGIPAKSLCLIPQRFALGMVEQGWILRNDIVWAKPNPMPESVKDRFTTSWEHLFFFVKSQKYRFEQQFEPMTCPGRIFNPDTSGHATAQLRQEGNRTTVGLHDGRTQYGDPSLGRNKRDVWEICTEPSPIRGVHFATYPEKLVETPILAGCPAQICKKCGKARGKIYEISRSYQSGSGKSGNKPHGSHYDNPQCVGDLKDDIRAGPCLSRQEIGYTDCGCNAGFEAGIVMDIFAGSGTTGAVAKRLGRKYIGIDLSEEYCRLHIKRLQAVPLAMALA